MDSGNQDHTIFEIEKHIHQRGQVMRHAQGSKISVFHSHSVIKAESKNDEAFA